MSEEAEKELKKLDQEKMKEERHISLSSKKVMSKMKNTMNQKTSNQKRPSKF